MVKFIFFTLLSITFGVLIFPYLYNGITYFGQAIELLVQASVVVLAVAIATFTPMTQYNYIMFIFYFGIFIMIINFIFKILTNHYISEEEDDSEYQKDLEYYENEYIATKGHYLRNHKNKKIKEDYYNKKADYELYKSNLMKNKYKESGKTKKVLVIKKKGDKKKR